RSAQLGRELAGAGARPAADVRAGGGSMIGGLLIQWVIISVLITVSVLIGFAYLTLLERRVLALMQVRIGPNRAGPLGLLQPVADGIKLFFKEELIPAQADRVIFVLAPIVTLIPALIILAVVA